jgi:IS5 family transposase
VRRVALPGFAGRRLKDRSVERQRWFRRAYRFRVGCEGRISYLRRQFGLDRCRHHDEVGMERWVGWGVLAHNLWIIGRTVAAR